MPHNKLPDSVYKERCNDLGLEFVMSASEKGHTRIHFICPKHRDRGEQDMAWSHFRSAAKGCKYCTGREKTKEQLQKELDERGVQVVVVGEYISARTKIEYRCKLCGETHFAIPNSLMNGQACPSCGQKRRAQKRMKDLSTFAYELSIVQPNIEIVGEYIHSHKPIKCKCKVDGTEWSSYPVNLLNLSAGCPTCQARISKGELAVMKYLDSIKEDYIHDHVFPDCRRSHPLRFDFYLPSRKAAIEFDGRQHYEEVPFFNSASSSLELTQERDRIKDDYCRRNGIKMVRIPYNMITKIDEIINNEIITRKTA